MFLNIKVCRGTTRIRSVARSRPSTLPVRSGEIVGIAGSPAMARTSCWRCSAANNDLRRNEAATIALARRSGCASACPMPVANSDWLSFRPNDWGHGAVPDLSLADNALLSAFQHGLVSKGLIQRSKVQALAQEIIRRFGVKTSGPHAPARSLSGGNLQKFILGREILQQPKLLVRARPTWGVDVGAAATIHRALDCLARCRRGDPGDFRRPRRIVPDQRPPRRLVRRPTVAAPRHGRHSPERCRRLDGRPVRRPLNYLHPPRANGVSHAAFS